MNPNILTVIKDYIIRDLSGKENESYRRAFTKAAGKLISGKIKIRQDGNSVALGSDSGELYMPTTEKCQCPAFEKGKLYCWHRAAFTLISRYNVVERSLNSFPALSFHAFASTAQDYLKSLDTRV